MDESYDSEEAKKVAKEKYEQAKTKAMSGGTVGLIVGGVILLLLIVCCCLVFFMCGSAVKGMLGMGDGDGEEMEDED